MKIARGFTLAGCIVLVVSAALHSAGYFKLTQWIQTAGARPSLDRLLQVFWLSTSVEFLTIAAIALVARVMERGGGIVLLCAACCGLTVILQLIFLGLFPGAYLLTTVTALFAIGGWLQLKHPA